MEEYIFTDEDLNNFNHELYEVVKKFIPKKYFNMEKTYNLDFHQALDILMNGGAVKGDNFADGIFLKLNSRGQLVTVDANRFYIEETEVFINSIYHQKFRKLTIMTLKELSV